MNRLKEIEKAANETGADAIPKEFFIGGALWADNSTIENIKNIIKIHLDSTEGSMDNYFAGMRNGMAVILSCLDGKEPEFTTGSQPAEKK
jgi:hypothetical protein